MQKRATLAIALISAALTGIISVSCSNPTAPQPKTETQKYTVSFDANGGDPAPEAQTVEAGKKVIRPAVDPAKNGFIFGGWFNDSGYGYSFDSLISKNLTLTAKWLCKITFSPGEGNFESGTSTEQSITIEPDAPITAPKVTRTG